MRLCRQFLLCLCSFGLCLFVACVYNRAWNPKSSWGPTEICEWSTSEQTRLRHAVLSVAAIFARYRHAIHSVNTDTLEIYTEYFTYKGVLMAFKIAIDSDARATVVLPEGAPEYNGRAFRIVDRYARNFERHYARVSCKKMDWLEEQAARAGVAIDPDVPLGGHLARRGQSQESGPALPAGSQPGRSPSGSEGGASASQVSPPPNAGEPSPADVSAARDGGI